MDIKSLYAAVAIADFGSFADAARSLRVSVSAVSVQIRALEKELGFPLFDRSTRPPALTEQGRLFVARAREVLAHWESLNDDLIRQTRGGVLRVGAVHTTVSGMVPPALRRLQDQCAELHIQLTTGLSHQLEDRLRRGALDAAVVTEPEILPDDVVFRRVIEEPLMVICHRSISGDSAKQILEANPYVRFNRQARVGQLIERALAARGIAVRSQMEIDTLDAVVRLVEERLGVSVVPVRRHGHTLPETIRAIGFSNPPLTRWIGVMEIRSNPRAHLVDLLFTELIRRL